jgi:hypothetical protein
MNLRSREASEARFAAYVEGLASVLGTPTGLGRCATIALG